MNKINLRITISVILIVLIIFCIIILSNSIQALILLKNNSNYPTSFWTNERAILGIVISAIILIISIFATIYLIIKIVKQI
jgi:hypothetical protein